MCTSKTLSVALLAVLFAAGPGAAQGSAQGAAQAPPKYPVKREQPPEPPPKPAAAPLAPKPAAPPAPAPAPAQPGRYPVKPAAPPASPAPSAPGVAAPATITPAVVEASPAADSFKAGGLINEPSLAAIYRGDFSQSSIDHEGPLLQAVMHSYLTSFAQRCSAYLPANKVEMMTQECATERVTTNGWGVETSRYCIEWFDKPTGLFADPELYAAKNQLERTQAADAFRSVFQMFTTGNPIGTAMEMVSQVQGARDDMARAVEMNACGGPGLKRFGENLRRFALNLTPLKLEGQPASSPAPPSRAPALPADQNFVRLVDDLIVDQSRSWVVNKYQSGSVGSANVVSRDVQGRPSRIEATYSFVGLNGPAAGSLVITFVDGAPNCIYFFDSPACRAPGRAIVAAYLDGRYAR